MKNEIKMPNQKAANDWKKAVEESVKKSDNKNAKDAFSAGLFDLAEILVTE